MDDRAFDAAHARFIKGDALRERALADDDMNWLQAEFAAMGFDVRMPAGTAAATADSSVPAATPEGLSNSTQQKGNSALAQ